MDALSDSHNGSSGAPGSIAERHGSPGGLNTAADLIAALVEPGEVAPGVHQPDQEHPALAPLAADLGDHLEEVDLGPVSGPMD